MRLMSLPLRLAALLPWTLSVPQPLSDASVLSMLRLLRKPAFWRFPLPVL